MPDEQKSENESQSESTPDSPSESDDKTPSEESSIPPGPPSDDSNSNSSEESSEEQQSDDNADTETPSDLCCWFYKDPDFHFGLPTDKFELCAQQNFYGDLLPHAQSLFVTGEKSDHFNDEMESFKCGAQVSADICSEHYTDTVVYDEVLGPIIDP